MSLSPSGIGDGSLHFNKTASPVAFCATQTNVELSIQRGDWYRD